MSAHPRSAPRIRVAFCVDTLTIGGTELNAIRTAEALDPNRFDLRVYHLQPDGPLMVRYRALGVPLTHVPISNLYSIQTAMRGVQLGRHLRSWGAQVVHAHDIYTNIFATPWSRLIGGCAVIASRRWWDYSPRAGLPFLNRMSYRLAHRVLANSEAVAGMLRSVESVPASKIVVIPNFLDDAAFQPLPIEEIMRQRAVWGVPPGSFLIGIIARLVPVKNHSLLLQALPNLDRQCHVVLIGDGESRVQLQEQARALGVKDRVHFAGEMKSRSNLHAYLDVSALCSLSEGFPNTLAEALAAARPVVATPAGGVVDIIHDGETGLLTPLGDPLRMAAAIRSLREDDRLRRKLGANGQLLVRNAYHQKVVIEKLSRLYEALVHVS